MLALPVQRRWKLILAAAFALVGLAQIAAYYWTQYLVSRDVARLRVTVATLAASDPSFSTLRAVKSTHPKAWIFGTLPTEAHRTRLRDTLTQSFTPAEANRLIWQVRLPYATASTTQLTH